MLEGLGDREVGVGPGRVLAHQRDLSNVFTLIFFSRILANASS